MVFSKRTLEISFVVVCFCIGVILAEFVGLKVFLYTLLVCACIAVLIYQFIFLKPSVGFIVVSICALFFGFFRFYIAANNHPPGSIEQYFGIKHQFKGIIVSEVDSRNAKQRFIIKFYDLKVPTETSKALMYVPAYPEYSYGSELLFEGVLTKPVDFQTDTGTWFDYDTYLSKDDVFYIIKNPYITAVEREKGNWLLTKLYNLKNFVIETIEHMLPSPQSSLLAGLIIAGKKSIPVDVMNDFKTAGIVHMVVLSGYNVTIVAVTIMAMLSRVKRHARLTIGAMLIILFSLMVGETATVVRSVIMALMALFAQMVYRDFDVIRALFLSGFVMIVWNPYYLMHDPSFQLSFLATIGLIFCSPVISYLLIKISPQFLIKLLDQYSIIRELIIASLSTQIFVLPYILYGTGIISLVALPANVLILLFIPLTMLVGSITVCIQWLLLYVPTFILFIASWVASISSFFVYLLLSYELYVAHWLASIPYAAIYTKHVPIWSVLCAYVAYAAILIWFYKTGRGDNQKLNLMLEIDSHKPPS